MARQLKVWGGNCFRGGCQVRGLVIAPTKKRAVALLSVVQMTPYYFNGWWGETRNATELALIVDGEGVWVYGDLLGQSRCVRLA